MKSLGKPFALRNFVMLHSWTTKASTSRLGGNVFVRRAGISGEIDAISHELNRTAKRALYFSRAKADVHMHVLLAADASLQGLRDQC